MKETLLPMKVVRRLTFQEREDPNSRVNANFLHRRQKTGRISTLIFSQTRVRCADVNLRSRGCAEKNFELFF